MNLEADLDRITSQFDFSPLINKRLFLTGGTGFFGRWLLALFSYINSKNKNKYLYVNVLSRDPNRFLANHPHYNNVNWLTFTLGDIRSFDWFKESCGSFDLMIHAAADTTSAYQSDGWRIFDDINLGSRRVIEFARCNGIKRTLLVSSGAVYGIQPSSCERVPENAQWACNPLLSTSAYGEGKRVMELLGALATRDGNPCIVARCFAFVGSGLPLDGHFAIGNFIRDALYRPEIIINGDGRAIRSYLYAADLAVWLLVLLMSGTAGTAYNVGSDAPISIRDLAFRVRNLLAPKKPVLIRGQPNIYPPSHYIPDISYARTLGLALWTDIDTAILNTAKSIAC